MATLTGPVGADVIKSLRGQIDFYSARGKQFARKWHDGGRQPNTEAQIQSRKNFGLVQTFLAGLGQEFREQIADMMAQQEQSTP